MKRKLQPIFSERLAKNHHIDGRCHPMVNRSNPPFNCWLIQSHLEKKGLQLYWIEISGVQIFNSTTHRKTQRHQFNFTTLELFHTVQTTVEREIVFIIKYHDKCFLCEQLGCEIRLFRQLGLLLALSCCPTAGTEA